MLTLFSAHRLSNSNFPEAAYPQAHVIAYADDCVVLHEERKVLEHCQQLLTPWLANIGLTLNTAKSRISHDLEGYEPNFGYPKKFML